MSSITRDYFRTGFKRWLRWIALAIVFAIGCGFLANWQWNRREQTLEIMHRISRNYEFRTFPLEAVVKNPAGFSLKYEYRPVEIAGQYQTDLTTYVRNRPLNGDIGFEQLIPFKLQSGRYVIVDRGWVISNQESGLPEALKTPVANRLIGRLQHVEQPDSRIPPHGQAMSVSPITLAKEWHIPLSQLYSGAYLKLADDGTKDANLVPSTAPDLTEGNHLSYAFQWVLFAIMAFLAIGFNIKRDLDEKREAEDPTFVPKPKRRKVGEDDNDAEDALIQNG